MKRRPGVSFGAVYLFAFDKRRSQAMKWLIASDLHGSAYYCRKLLEAYDLEKADRMLLLGDILYHGPRNDLPTEYAPKQDRKSVV